MVNLTNTNPTTKQISVNTKNYAANNLSLVNFNTNIAVLTNPINNLFIYSPSVYSDDSFEEIGHILDKFCEYMILPVQEKIQPFIS